MANIGRDRGGQDAAEGAQQRKVTLAEVRLRAMTEAAEGAESCCCDNCGIKAVAAVDDNSDVEC